MTADDKLMTIERKLDELERLVRQVLTATQAANQSALRAEAAARSRS